MQAIRERRLLGFVYHDRQRIVEPHIYGLADTGNEILSTYQIAGESRTGRVFGWHTFNLSGARHILMGRPRFHGPRPDYNPEDPSFAHVFARL